MKKLLLLTAFMAVPAIAGYVSPTEYKSWSCDEMQYELQYQIELGVVLFNESLNAGMSLNNAPSAKRTADYAEALRQTNDVDTARKGLEEAMRRVGCEVKGAIAPVVPEE